MQTLDTIITALISSGAFTLATIWLTKTWLSERLRQSIAHEYAQLLERHKAELAAASAAELERAKAGYSQERAVRALGEDYLREAARVAHTKRIEAIQVIWSALLRVTSATPDAVGMTDYLTAEELSRAPSNPKAAASFTELNQASIAAVFRDSADAGEARLLAGEYLYALFDAYRTIVGRAIYLSIAGASKGIVSPWYQDPSVLGLMARVFSPAEMSVFERMEFARFTWLRTEIERKFIERAERIATGEESALAAVGQARIIEASASQFAKAASNVEELRREC